MTDPNSSIRQDGASAGTNADTELSTDDVADLADRVIENIETVIMGKRRAIEDTFTAVLGRGHVLLEDVPGTGKTMLARSLAHSFDGTFKRVQFTPDLLPSDITGMNVYNQANREFEFQAGPVFANVVLGDEINRAPPKTQSALLEAMEEQQVTVDGTTYPMDDPFIVIATQNSVEPSRTYELPIAQVDRFMKKIELGYPDDEEPDILARVVGEHPIETIGPVASIDELRAARSFVANVTVKEPVREYAAAIAKFTRQNARLGVSPRGTIALMRAAQARAAINGRDYVIPDDLQYEAATVLSHRVYLESDPDGSESKSLVENAVSSVAIP